MATGYMDCTPPELEGAIAPSEICSSKKVPPTLYCSLPSVVLCIILLLEKKQEQFHEYEVIKIYYFVDVLTNWSMKAPLERKKNVALL